MLVYNIYLGAFSNSAPYMDQISFSGTQVIVYENLCVGILLLKSFWKHNSKSNPCKLKEIIYSTKEQIETL